MPEATAAPTRIVVAQGGGPTAVINQSLVGIVQEARRHRDASRGAAGPVEAIYGARHGVRGVLNEDFIDLGAESDTTLEAVAATPAAALGSTRDKPNLEYCRGMFEVLRAHRITHFFNIGGNDSSDSVRIVAEEAARAGYALRCMHVPKTIDNDLVLNDHTPGYASAARFVMQAFGGANFDNAALPGVYVGVVMGRHAGFLTAAAALARGHPDDGPHLVFLPERTFEMPAFLAQVKAVHDRLGRCVVAVSEGIHGADGRAIAETLAGSAERDAHGNVQLSGTGALADLLCEAIKAQTGIKRVRGDTFGYLQRSFLGCVSDVDSREARAVGVRAAAHVLGGGADGSVAMRRVAGAAGDAGGSYAVELSVLPLQAVAGKTRTMEDHYIAPGGCDVTRAFFDYLRPLLGSDLPQSARLAAQRVPRVLKQ